MKHTLLDYIILGLVQYEALSGYRIRKMFEETALGNFSSSPGTIYPALKRLEKYECVEKVLKPGTSNAHFHITSKGVLVLKEWLSEPIEREDIQKRIHVLLLRFSFMETLIRKNQKIDFLISFRDLLKIYIQELQDFTQQTNDMQLHGKLAVQHGIDSYKTTLKWCKMALLQISKS